MSTKAIAGVGGIAALGLAAYLVLRGTGNDGAVGAVAGAVREYTYEKTFLPASESITTSVNAYRLDRGMPAIETTHEQFVLAQPSPYKEAIQVGTAVLSPVKPFVGFAPLDWVARRGADYQGLIDKGYIGKTAPVRMLRDLMWSW